MLSWNKEKKRSDNLQKAAKIKPFWQRGPQNASVWVNHFE